MANSMRTMLAADQAQAGEAKGAAGAGFSDMPTAHVATLRTCQPHHVGAHASYDLNPNGAESFGNAVEEAQGGIHYVCQRYDTADRAADFWRERR